MMYFIITKVVTNKNENYEGSLSCGQEFPQGLQMTISLTSSLKIQL